MVLSLKTCLLLKKIKDKEMTNLLAIISIVITQLYQKYLYQKFNIIQFIWQQ